MKDQEWYEFWVAGQPFEDFYFYMNGHVNGFAMMYGGPVYLVGSALYLEKPRDYDVRCIISERDRKRLFGATSDERNAWNWWDDASWLRASEALKQARRLSMNYPFRVDFQIQTEAEARKYESKPRVRLDSATDYLLAWPDRA